MKQNALRLSLVGILALGSLNLTACSDEDVALGAGVIIGVIIGSAGDHDHHGHGHRPPPPPPHRPPPRPPRPHRPGRYSLIAETNSASLNSNLLPADAAVSPEVAATAEHFQVPVEAATEILSALRSAEKKDFDALSAIGFERSDLKAIGRGENPSATALRAMSENLGLELAQAHEVIQQMKKDLGQQ